VEFGQRAYGDAFFVPVKPHPIERPLTVEHAHGRHVAHGNGRHGGTPHAADVPAQRTETGGA
jgi:hypothetical protein